MPKIGLASAHITNTASNLLYSARFRSRNISFDLILFFHVRALR